MTELLASLAPLTLGGSAAILALALTARLSRARYAARWRCWVWLLLCLRLAVPISIQLPERTELAPPIQISAPSDTVIYTYRPAVPAPQQPIVQPSENTRPVSPAPEIVAPSSPDPEPVPAHQELTLFEILGTAWLAGAAAMLGWYALSHLRFLTYLRRWSGPVVNAQTIRLFNAVGDALELDRRPELRVCTGLSVPALAGIFLPKLLLPEGELSEEELRYSLLHELTHFKRRDIWLKSLALLVNAVHWFNPLMWYMTRLVERDTELACDEAALRSLPVQEHGAYGKTILNAVERLKATAR